MRFLSKYAVLVLAILFVSSCAKTTKKSNAKEVVDTYVADNYNKKEVAITMRDGAKLHTTIYSPKDSSILYTKMCVADG